MNRIVLITPGQPSSNPRLVKEAISLDRAGYSVTVIYCFWVQWADQYDRIIIKDNPSITWIRIGGHPVEKKIIYWYTRFRHKLYRVIAQKIKPSVYWQQRAIIRCYNELKHAAVKIQADLYIAHNAGALAPAAIAAVKNQSMYAFDGEDFHRGEFSDNTFLYKAIMAIEDKYIPRVQYFTAASPLIANAYRKCYPEKEVVVINNVFSRDFLQPLNFHSKNAVNLFWFSQTVGSNRGLETVIKALNQLREYNFTLHILGYCPESYREELIKLSGNPSTLNFIPPVSLQEIFKIAAQADIGLATEIPYCENRKICLTNKLFIYLLSGICIVASDTEAQQRFFSEYPGIGLLYKNEDVTHLTAQFKVLFEDKSFLQSCRRKASALAETTLNWEKESEKLLTIVNACLG